MMKKKNRLLLFAYFYPPLGGPAVQRPLKMIKYLFELGWEVDVISVKDIVYHSRDESLLVEDKAAAVYRTESADAMATLKKISKKGKFSSRRVYFHTPEFIKKFVRSSFIIDDKYGWLKYALKKARELCSNNSYSAVMATIVPFTSAMAAYKISCEFDLPLVVDYRDQWNLNSYLKYLTPLHRKISYNWEKKILEKSKLISTAGRLLSEDLITEFGEHLKDKVQVIYNGWDQEDFKEIEQVVTQGRNIIISYLGSLYGKQTVKYFVKALKELQDDDKLPGNLEIRFVGNFYKENLELLNSENLRDLIKIIPQVDHHRALELMAESDILMLFFPSNIFRGVVMGKIFEYFRSQKMIFGMVPLDSETVILLKEHGHQHFCAMEDIGAIKFHLMEIFTQLSNRQIEFNLLDIYSRKNQIKLFAQRLNKII